MDIIFPVSQGSRQQIHIVYNQQMDLCTKQEDNANCRKAQNLCIADPDFKFDMNSPDSNVRLVIFYDYHLIENDFCFNLILIYLTYQMCSCVQLLFIFFIFSFLGICDL